ncbi:hypothetical protein [Flavobacterium sp. MDT1-60]|uniref:hypothetical protein n=1 Tax=Flavobacterium sp. MDT1-60 TaxID=1979344 RepID=UPI0017839381|nr:hypothetical protein [Flavobacterium sp. MDT1-60]QOG01889.1 hypothetical protein IHE43_19115 [Flavobacterium sp. MDT1-60]
MKKYKFILLVIMFLLKTIVAESQNKTNEMVINHFVKAVFFEKNNTKFIADNYIYFEPINNTKYSTEDRIKILDKHLKKIKKEKSSLINPANFSVVPYNEYKGVKAVFSKTSDNIFILISKNNPVMYFSVINDKIFSFDYITKGDESLFITY